MTRAIRRTTAFATLAAFGAICFAPRGAAADDDVPRAAPRPAQPAYPAQPAQPAYPAQPPPPGYPAYPPGYPAPAQPAYPGYPPGYNPYPTYTPPAPPRMKLVERPRLGMAIAGASIFGGVWLFTAMSGYASGNNAAIVPVIGPLFYLRGDDDNFGRVIDNRLANVGLIFVTLAQTTGVVLFAAGLASKQKTWVRESELTVAPTVVPGGGGIAAAMRF